ncbi:hypothetical protein OHB26_31720 [Nocardia sp. NBC_01503]|uniref:DUF6545 domain-containing protein n=1 Tax=Nocardia sp. NBC_01503 TaxID=2975997 RepID=UPI002E7BED34|nr:DUF6545 domain-containing protein [Nocardia sp. NBC_01503]WTL31438.1 hypothetical protein OHB26_31720 [Nocardia sp. NBC_01503]
MSPSSLLVAEATSSLTEPVMAVLLAWIAIAGILRMSVLLERVRLDWAVAVLIWSYWSTALLRDRAMQSVLTRWVALADVRLATHAAALVGAGAILWIGLLWRARRPVRGPVVTLIWAGVVVLAGALAWISAPARAADVAVEELPGVRPGIYLTVYTLPTALAEIPVLIIAVSLMWHWRQSLARAAFGLILTVCIAFSQIDAWSRIITGWLITAGTRDELTAHRASGNDLLFLLPVAVLMLLTVPSIVTSLAIRLHRDSASRNVRVLGPMWEDMMTARPEMRLNVPRSTLVQVSEHRMRIEIEDTMISAAPHLTGLHAQPTPAQVCHALRSALAEGGSESGDRRAAAPAWVGDEAFVLDIAREWTRTRPAVADDSNAHARKALL